MTGVTARRRSRRAHAAVAVGALLVGVVVGRASQPSPDRPPEPPNASRGRPAPSERGAIAEAIGYLDALRWNVVIDTDRRRAAIAEHATPEAAPQLDAQLSAPAEGLRAAVTRPPVLARTAFLGYRVEAYRPERAVVSVWGMSLFGSGAYPVATQWSTSRIVLAWAGDRWLVADVDSRGGPSPDSPLKTLVATSRAFRELRHAP